MSTKTTRVVAPSSLTSLVRSLPLAAILFAVTVPVVLPPAVSLPVLVVSSVCWLLLSGSASRFAGMRVPVAAPIFVVLCAASVAWSENVSATAIDSAFLAMTSVIATIVAVALPRGREIATFRNAFVLLALACLAYTIAFPNLSFVEGAYKTGAFKAFYGHRNYFAWIMAVGFATSLAAITRRRWFSGSVAALFLLAMTVSARSSTSLVLCFVAVVIVAIDRFARRLSVPGRAALAIAGVTTGSVLAIFVTSDLEYATSLVGRNATFTGRTIIWTTASEQVALRPFLGSGWGAVWGDTDLVGNVIRNRIGFNIIHAHNGFLDAALQVGLPGATLLFAIIIGIVLKAWRQQGVARINAETAVPLWVGMLMVLMLVASLVEVRATNQFGWFLIIFCSCLLLRRPVSQKTNVVRGSAEGSLPDPDSVLGDHIDRWSLVRHLSSGRP